MYKIIVSLLNSALSFGQKQPFKVSNFSVDTSLVISLCPFILLENALFQTRISLSAYSSVTLGSRSSMSFDPNKSLNEGVGSLLGSQKYSDLTLNTRNRSFKLHKAIVCSQSTVLAAMCDSGFKESSTSILRLEHDDPVTVERMLKFLYTGKYDHGDFNSSVCQILMASTLVYSIADKYDIKGLKMLAKAKFESRASLAWGCEDYPAVVAKVFDTTPDTDVGLRDIVGLACADHIDEILVSETWGELLSNKGTIGLVTLKFVRQRSIEALERARKESEALKHTCLRWD